MMNGDHDMVEPPRPVDALYFAWDDAYSVGGLPAAEPWARLLLDAIESGLPEPNWSPGLRAHFFRMYRGDATAPAIH